jgi:hypothetical protein
MSAVDRRFGASRRTTAYDRFCFHRSAMNREYGEWIAEHPDPTDLDDETAATVGTVLQLRRLASDAPP